MFRIQKSSLNEIREKYLDLYSYVFEEEDFQQAPSVIYVGYEDEKCVGFTAGYLRNLNTFYMQYMGILPGLRKGRNGVKYFKSILDELDKEHLYLEGAIKNDNIVALKMALKYGFRVIGTRIDTNGNLFVEILRENPKIEGMLMKINREV